MKKKAIALVPLLSGIDWMQYVAGRPFFYWLLDAARDCPSVDSIFLSGLQKEIGEAVSRYSSPKRVSFQFGPSEEVLPLLNQRAPSTPPWRVLLRPSIPLIDEFQLDQALKNFFRSDAEAMVSVSPLNAAAFYPKNGFLCEAGPLSGELLIPNDALLVSSRDTFMENLKRPSPRSVPHRMETVFPFRGEEPFFSDFLLPLLTKRLVWKRWNERLARIRLLVMDADGVLTNGCMYYSPEGEFMKRFHTRDGMGLKLLQENGFQVAIITGEKTEIVPQRAKKLKISNLYLGISDKLPVLIELLEKLSLKAEETAYIGDDVNDLQAIRHVGFSACPSDAIDVVRQNVHYVCKAPGGYGCIREVCDLLISHKNGDAST